MNEQTTFSAFLADRFGNFNVLTGTSVSFITEAGAIDRSAVTDNVGIASLILRTQAPSPIDVDPRDPLNPLGAVGTGETYNNISGLTLATDCNGFDPGEPFEDFDNDAAYDVCEHFTDLDGDGYELTEPNPRDGWVTVVGFTRGEEAFNDSNGNGVYDSGEPFTDSGGEPYIDSNDNGIYDAPETFTDQNFNNTYEPGEPFTDVNRGEPFLDLNLSGAQNGTEPFTDLNGNAAWDAAGFANLIYDPGELFIDVNGDGSWTHGNGVWDADTTIWLSRRVLFSRGPNFGPFTSRIVIANAVKAATPSQFAIPDAGCGNFTIYLSDYNGNPLTGGSEIDIQVDVGKIFGGGKKVILDAVGSGPLVYPITICDDDPAEAPAEPADPAALTVTGIWKTTGGGDILFDFPTITGTID